MLHLWPKKQGTSSKDTDNRLYGWAGTHFWAPAYTD